MADPVSDSLQFWAKMRADQPLRDAQVQAYRDQHDELANTREGGQALVKLLASMGALDSQTQPPSPDATGGATSAQTFPYQTPAAPMGRPMPLTSPGGGMPSIPSPGQASTPMQAPSPAALLGPLAQAYLSKQPQNAQPAALQVLLANAMAKGATARAPAPNAPPAGAPTAPPMGGPAPGAMGAPGGAPGAGPAPGVVPSPAPQGWQSLRQPQGPGAASAGMNPDLPLGGRGVEPTKMPSVPVMAKRLLDSGVNPEAAYFALKDYEQIQDKETKQVMDGLRMQASVYRTMLSAANERMRALASESAGEDRKASLAERERHDKAMEGRASGIRVSGAGANSPTGLTPEGLDVAAEKYRATGVMPGLGFSTTAAKLAIINRAAVLDAQEGGSASSLPGRQAEFKANSAALVNVTKDLTAIAPYQQMLETNADIAIDLAKQVTKSDLPIANKSINWVEQNVTGNPTMAEYLAQIKIVQTEAARVLNNPRLVGQLTDSARHEMEGIVNGNLTVAQTVSVLGRLKSDGNNRVNAMRDQSEKLRKSLGASSTKPSASSTAKEPTSTNAKGWQLMTDKNGNRAYVSPDKKQFEAVQ